MVCIKHCLTSLPHSLATNEVTLCTFNAVRSAVLRISGTAASLTSNVNRGPILDPVERRTSLALGLPLHIYTEVKLGTKNLTYRPLRIFSRSLRLILSS